MNFETWLQSDLTKPLKVQALHGVFFSADNAANLIGVEVFDGGTAASLSGTCIGYAIRADGGTLTITGTVSGNKASIILPTSAYVLEGPLDIVIKVVSGSVRTTVGACRGYVVRATTDAIIDPGHVIPSLEELLAQIDACEQATDAANTAASNANSKATAANTAASNANTATSNANTATNRANAAAAALENMDATASGLAAGASPTATVSTVNSHYRIALGIPKGDKGEKGDTGNAATITGTVTTYQNSTSGDTVPTGTWETTQPTTPQGQYLWTRTVLTWNNGQTTTLYSVSRQGIDGEGSVQSVNSISPDANGNVVLPVDATPTNGSSNPVSSDGVYDALAGKQATLTSPMAYLGSNITGGTANDTGAFWAAQGTGYAYFDQDGQLNGQPNRWGFLVSWVNGTQIYQEYHLYPDGNQYKRGSNGSGAMPEWTQMATQAAVAGKVSKSGDTMTGILTVPTQSAVKGTATYTQIDYKNNNGDRTAALVINNSTRRAYWLVECTDTDYHENFVLPAPDTGRTANRDYDILTSKTFNPNTVAIIAPGATAPLAITAGQYVIWKGALYTAKSNIASGAALSTSNLTAVSGGGLNAIANSVNPVTRSVYNLRGISAKSFSISNGVSSTWQCGLLIVNITGFGNGVYAIFFNGSGTGVITAIASTGTPFSASLSNSVVTFTINASETSLTFNNATYITL